MSDGLAGVILVAYGAAIVAALVTRAAVNRALVAFASMIAAASTIALGVAVLAGLAAPRFSIQSFALAPLSFAADPLAAFFLILIGTVGFAAVLYGWSYSSGFHSAAALRASGASLSLLLLTMTLQVLADNPFTFLFVWELMSLAAYFLVLAEADREGAVSAANWYLGVTHAGFAALVAMFFLLSGGDLGAPFASIRSAPLAGASRHAVFLLALAGFGAKAGLVPLHVWLPRAHPVAPSHGSAIMSGVVLKMGVYGFVRVIFDLVGSGPAWWGMTVLGLGTISALLGVLYALMEHDLKRLLAYHSIENVGLIFMGAGAALLFLHYGMPLVAAVALAAALYHTLNHACFKGLLFLGAGAVVQATGTRNIEELGGLIKRMPVTAFAFLIGAAAISALPPLNGFASEWLLFQALLGGSRIPAAGVALTMPIAVGLLALTSGLAAACFVKAFGITFLAIPRSPHAERAVEAPRSMLAAMLILVAVCAVLGLTPFLVVPVLGRVMAPFRGLEVAASLHGAGSFVSGLPAGVGQMSPAYVALALAVTIVVTSVALRLFTPRFRLRREETWGCGRLVQTPRMQYTATSFAEPLKRVFAEIYRAREALSVEVHPESKYFIRGISYETRIQAHADRFIYAPAIRLIGAIGLAARRLQSGSVHLYLAYMCAALVILLLAARWLP